MLQTWISCASSLSNKYFLVPICWKLEMLLQPMLLQLLFFSFWYLYLHEYIHACTHYTYLSDIRNKPLLLFSLSPMDNDNNNKILWNDMNHYRFLLATFYIIEILEDRVAIKSISYVCIYWISNLSHHIPWMRLYFFAMIFQKSYS